MFAQTVLQVHLDHQVSQESQGTKDTRDLQGKKVKMVSRAHQDQPDLKGPLELTVERVLKVIEDLPEALETKGTRVTQDHLAIQVLLA